MNNLTFKQKIIFGIIIATMVIFILIYFIMNSGNLTGKEGIDELSEEEGMLNIEDINETIEGSEENEIIKNNLGLYSLSPENQYHEVFAETFTKIICNCLSPQDSLPVKNPLEEMKSLPCEFLRILAKLF